MDGSPAGDAFPCVALPPSFTDGIGHAIVRTGGATICCTDIATDAAAGRFLESGSSCGVEVSGADHAPGLSGVFPGPFCVSFINAPAGNECSAGPSVNAFVKAVNNEPNGTTEPAASG